MNKSLLLPLALAVISVVGVDAQVPDLEEVRILAEQGDAIAQYNLGLMSASGRGVPEDDVEAVRWYRLAADQGYATAQYNLGNRYANGEGVPEDDLLAYMWWNLAAAQRMSTEWIEAHPPGGN